MKFPGKFFETIAAGDDSPATWELMGRERPDLVPFAVRILEARNSAIEYELSLLHVTDEQIDAVGQ